MSRSLAERATDPLWWFEQCLHAGLGAIVCWLTLQTGLPVAVAVAVSCFAGAAREIIQNHDDVGGSLGDSLADCGAWALGALVAGL